MENGTGRSQYAAWLMMGGAMLLVGSSVVAAKLMTTRMPPMLGTWLRFLIATALLLPLLLKREGLPRALGVRVISVHLLQGFCGVFLFNTAMLYGLRHSGAVEASLLTGAIPAVTALLAALLLGERQARQVWIGIVLTVIGAMLLNLQAAPSGGTTTWLGLGLIATAVTCEALYAVLGKFVSRKMSALAITTGLSASGALLFTPFALADLTDGALSRLDLFDWALIVYFAVAVTVLAFWLFCEGLRVVPAAVAGTFTAFVPLSAVALSALLLNEPLHLVHLFAAVLILGGVTLVVWKPRRWRLPAQRSSGNRET